MSNQGNIENTKAEDKKPKTNQFFEIINSILHLEEGVDKRNTIHEIKNKKSMSGANAWMLLCSIMIASIGLDTNSTAVIIGAMLISPLMSPILGMGLGTAINDWETVKSSIQHFGIAIAIAILTSSLYFFLSPFGEITPEIEARTTPTFLDIFIALFGGVAGIISVARKDISTTIPGVAIATALMPPLCVTGFGIANGEWNIAFSSFYLFFLNTFFVAGASFLLVRYLNFPQKQYINKKEQRRNTLISVIISLIIIVPSIMIFKQVITEFRTEVKVQNFISEYLGDDRLYLDDYQYIKGEDTQRLVLKVYGQKINVERIPELKIGLAKYGLSDIEPEIIATSDIKLDRLELIESRLDGVSQIKDQLKAAQEEQKARDKILKEMETRLVEERIDSLITVQIEKEAKVLFPNLDYVYIGKLTGIPLNDTLPEDVTHIFIESEKTLKAKEKQEIKEWFNVKLGTEGRSRFYF